MVLARTLTKRFKNSVSKKFNGGSLEEHQVDNDDKFYAINFNATDPTQHTNTISTITEKNNKASSVHSAESSSSSTLSRASSIKRTGTESLKRASSLLSRKSSTSSRNVSKPPSITFPITPTGPSVYSHGDDYISYTKATDIFEPNEEVQNMLPPSAPLPLKKPPSHRKIPSISSSTYPSLASEMMVDGSQNMLFPPASIRSSATDNTFADEVAMEILEKISAEEYTQEIKIFGWSI